MVNFISNRPSYGKDRCRKILLTNYAIFEKSVVEKSIVETSYCRKILLSKRPIVEILPLSKRLLSNHRTAPPTWLVPLAGWGWGVRVQA
jgi:hypothetical protein